MPANAAIIFDFDGVILDSEGLQYRAYSEVLAPFSVHISIEEYGREWTGNGRGAEYAIATYGLPITADELRSRKNGVYYRLLQQPVHLMAGAREALDRLHADYPLALATNSTRAEVDLVVDRFGLNRFFTAIVTREDYAAAKPAPDAFLTAAARLGVVPARCVVIEDAHKGVVAAAAAGCKCIAVPNDFTRANDFSGAALVLPSLDAVLPAVIESLLS